MRSGLCGAVRNASRNSFTQPCPTVSGGSGLPSAPSLPDVYTCRSRPRTGRQAMTGGAFNPLAAVRDLEAAGVDRKRAGALRQAATADRDEFATKADLAALEARMYRFKAPASSPFSPPSGSCRSESSPDLPPETRHGRRRPSTRSPSPETLKWPASDAATPEPLRRPSTAAANAPLRKPIAIPRPPTCVRSSGPFDELSASNRPSPSSPLRSSPRCMKLSDHRLRLAERDIRLCPDGVPTGGSSRGTAPSTPYQLPRRSRDSDGNDDHPRSYRRAA